MKEKLKLNLYMLGCLRMSIEHKLNDTAEKWNAAKYFKKSNLKIWKIRRFRIFWVWACALHKLVTLPDSAQYKFVDQLSEY